jgi:hypothetical protein
MKALLILNGSHGIIIGEKGAELWGWGKDSKDLLAGLLL